MAYSTSSDAWGLSGDDLIIAEAKKRFKACEDWEATARTNFEFDYKFANGDSINMYQWDSWVVGDRQQNDRPCLTINKTMQHNLQIINDGKQNKPGVNIRPVGDTASFEAAQIFQEVVRHIEYISNAESTYDNASEFQVNGGWGYWTVTTDYFDDTSFDQEIFIRRVKDPRSVYLDPDINETDGSDAAFGFIFSDKPKDLYEAEYPDFKDVGGNSVFSNSGDGWYNKDHVRVAKYYRKIRKEDKYVSFTLPETGEEVESFYSELPDDGKEIYKEIIKREGNLPIDERSYRERRVVRGDIEVYKIAGNIIIERSKWLGKYIPIVRVIGRETVIDGVLDRPSHTRALLDPQRIYNVNSSSNVEFGALQTKSPVMAAGAAIENYEEYYRPLALDTRLPTPNGWTTMGEVAIGDWLFDENGEPVQVKGMSAIHINRKCYRIEFDDGSHIVADEDHEWTIERRKRKVCNAKDWITVTVPTKDLVADKDHIWCSKPLTLGYKDLLIDPYVLGYWLGDGSSGCNRISCGDEDITDLLINLSNKGYWIGQPRKDRTCYEVTIHGMREHLVRLGLLNNKHIPSEYLRASYAQRLSLLQGLMDSDGHYHKATKQCVFVNVDKVVIDGISELLLSLGIKPLVNKYSVGSIKNATNGKTYECADQYRVGFSVGSDIEIFKLNRKMLAQTESKVLNERRAKRFKIVAVTEVASVPVRCVAINSISHLFLAGESMIPTHNTANTVNHAYMPFNHIDDQGNPIPAPSRMAAPTPGTAYVQQMQIAQNEMMMVSGQYQAQMGENENAKSGVAINARQRQGDRATYHFIDGLANAIRFTGKILIDLIPKIYDTKRIMKIEAKDGTVIDLTIDPNAPQAYQKLMPDVNDPTQSDEQMIKVIFNPSVGRYTVQSETGPSFATRRQEAFNALTQIAAQNKEFMGIAGDILWKVADFPEAQILAQRWRKIIPPNISGDAPNPQLTAAMEQASQKIEQQLATIANMQQQLDDKDRELKVKEANMQINAANTMLDNVRADYRAIDDRIKSLGNSGPGISIEQIQPLINQAVMQALRQGGPSGDIDVEHMQHGIPGPGVSEGGTPVEPPQANAGAENSSEGAEPPAAPEGLPPGAKQAPNGRYYVQDGEQYLEVRPNG